jgi:4-alpha-glucanotransferase
VREKRGRIDHSGIVSAYKDTSDQWRYTTRETRRELRRAMGLDPDDDAPRRDAPEIRVLTDEATFRVSQPSELTLEDGTRLWVDECLPADLPIGYHQLQSLDGRAATWVIRRPAHCWLPPALRTWGWAVQLYAARSRSSWGIGDLGDLRRLADWSQRLGAGALLINPLCAVAPEVPQQASPYYPSSRRFRNPLYLRIEDIPGADHPAVGLPSLAAAAQAANAQRRIDRDQVFRQKMEALERIWELGVEDEGFAQYCAEQGESLRSFAAFCLLAERYGGDWRRWPGEYWQPDSPAVRRFAQDASSRWRFHQWLQWQLDRQLAAAGRILPLVTDLPIGVSPGGADAWQWQDVLAEGATVGAPPDQFNADGQDWALPPFIPHRLRAAGYRPLIETIRASLRHAGGLRMDHVMGLFRLYWIPQGQGPGRGGYVRYAADELLAIVAVESHRARAWVAGEDLGTVEKQVRRQLAKNRILSYRLLWFEDEAPADFPEHALSAVSTHDLPTVAGLWTGADFAAQQRIGQQPSKTGFQQIRERLLAATGLSEDATPAQAVAAAYRALGQSRSAVLAASLDDALVVEQRPNMPGTTVQWPNWSLALPQPLEELESAPLPQQIADSLRRAKPPA